MKINKFLSLSIASILAILLASAPACGAASSVSVLRAYSAASGGAEAQAGGVSSVSIDLVGTDLTYIHTHGKDEKYPGNTVSIQTSSGATDTFSRDVEVKGRGNTSWTYPDKKSYQLKFSEKTDVLSMGAAKKWVLIANAFDESLIRNQVAMHLASELGMRFVPEFRFAEVTIDGDYRGLYILGEKVEIGSNRLNLSDPAGVLVELDNFFYDENEYYFFDDYLDGNAFALKEAVDEDTEGVAEEALKSFRVKLDDFLDFLYSKSACDISLGELDSYIDVDSFVEWYLINEFLLNVEAYSTSFYWYTDGEEDVLHLGPVWDFDSCMGNKEDFSDTTLMYMRDQKLFSRLLAVPDFYERVCAIYAEHIDVFEGLSDFASDLGDSILAAADRNFDRWHVEERDTMKPDIIEENFETYTDAVTSLSDWLAERFLLFSYLM